MDDLVVEASDHHLAAREPEYPSVVDEPDRHVPALPEQAQRTELEIRKLCPDESASEGFIDLDLGSPLAHAEIVSAPPTSGLRAIYEQTRVRQTTSRGRNRRPAPVFGNVTRARTERRRPRPAAMTCRL